MVKMGKKWCLLFIMIALASSTYMRQVDVTPVGETGYQVVAMGFPVAWLEANTTLTEENVTVTTYNIIWEGLAINIAFYGVIGIIFF